MKIKKPAKAIKKKIAKPFVSGIKIIDIPNYLFIPNQKVFNCGIIDYQGATFLFYRYELPYGDYNTEIGYCELDSNFQPKENSNYKINVIRHTAKITTFDDPRPFVLRGELHFIFAHGMVVPFSNYNGWCCSLGIAKMQNGKVSIPLIPNYGQNVNGSNKGRSNHYAQEKNWMPLVHKNALYFVYMINPLTVIECDTTTGECREVNKGLKYDLSFWKEGDFFAGGTPFVEYRGKFYGFFHTFTLDKPNTPSARRYHVGLMCLDSEMKLSEISKKPIMSADWDDAQDLRPLNNWWRPNCIFPCGLVLRIIDEKDYFCMSYGWQDCRCKIAMIPVEEALSGMTKVKSI